MSSEYDYRRTPTMRLLRSLVETHDRLRKLDDRQIRGYGLSTAEFDCLVTLGVEHPLRMCDLAERSLVTKSHATQIVKQLEAKELVSRQRSRQSEREVLVSLTPEGIALFNRVYPVQYEFLKELFGSRLAPAEQEQLTGLLRKLADQL